MRPVSRFAWITAGLGVAALAAGFAFLPASDASSQARVAARRAPDLGPSCVNQITQDFPATGTPETTWVICWREVRGNDSRHDPNGLVIGPVFFQTSPSAPLRMVISDMRMSEIFVPYHPGHPRFYDLSAFNFRLTTVTSADCPASAGGQLLSTRVCKELRDRGVMWKDFTGVRRGQELVLWGAIDAGNYRYIQEYIFRDDGVIMGRIGATGQNLPGAELVPHAHDAVWRIDMDVGGGSNTVAHVEHIEDPADQSGQAADNVTTLTVAQGINWSARRHDALIISNPSITNGEGRPITYQLMPLVTGGGLTQHTEEWSQHDFWVTPFDENQFAARKLPKYVQGNPSIVNQDIVLWIKNGIHHMPRAEDGVYNGSGNWVGTAHVMWSGFMLMPHDLFDCSPFYQPCPP